MAKKKNKSSWNYRILTGLDKYGWREFFLTEVYYKNEKPVSYAPDLNPLSGWDKLKDLKWTVKHLKEALKKPILDSDNNLEEWKTE